MIFTSLEVNNFMSVSHCVTRLDNRGLVLIQGENKDSNSYDSNGAGKSTVFTEAPCWCLFGETIRGEKGDDVVRKGCKNTLVKLGIQEGKDTYEVHRYRKHKEHKNNVLLFHNGVNITGKSDTATTNKIMDILQMDFSSFTNSVMFGQGVSKMFAISTDSEQKKILERMLQIDIFKACQDKAKEHLDAIHTDGLVVLTVMRDSESKQSSLVTQIKKLRLLESELQTKIDTKILELEADIQSHTQSISELPDITAMTEDTEELSSILDKIQLGISKYSSYQESMDDLSLDIRALNTDISKTEKEIEKSQKNLNNIRIGKNLPKICDSCGQALPQNDTSHLEKHLQDAIEKLEQEVKGKQKELTGLQGLFNKVKIKIQERDELQGQYDELEEERKTTLQAIKDTQQKKSMHERFIGNLSTQIQEQENLRSTTYTDIINFNTEELESVRKQLELFNKQAKELQAEQNLYKFWVDAYGNQGIKSVLLDTVTPFLNQRANYYLTKLTDSTVEVAFNTQTELKTGEKRDKFSVGINNKVGGETYKANSGGEKKRVDIAINMALQDLVHSRSNKKIDFIVYDEVFESLDSTGAQAVIELLQEKAQNCGTVLVITHNEHLKELFTKVITVSKENKQTVVSEEAV